MGLKHAMLGCFCKASSLLLRLWILSFAQIKNVYEFQSFSSAYLPALFVNKISNTD